ncbi:hypothetical protein P3W45_000870 [Vairimorpha bombi]
MEISKYSKNVSEIDRRKSLPRFGNTNNISVLDRTTPFPFIRCTSESVKLKEEVNPEDQVAYVPSFTYTPHVVSRIDDGTYVPPTSTVNHESISVKISNYALDIKREELYKIITGHTQVRFGRFHMVMDRETGVSKGYTFVSVGSKEDASRLINDLKVVIIDNLRLCVELAKTN